MSDDERPIAIVPARGGSKRIPRKNVLPFCDTPMIGHTIAVARDSGLFADILVSTDDDEIAAVAEAHGARVPFRRPETLANDHAGTAEVVIHALEWLRDHERLPAACCTIYATAPLLQPEHLAEGLATLRAHRAPTVFAAVTFPHPIFRALRSEADGSVAMFWPEHRTTRSQDLPEAIHDAGQFYWLDSRRFLDDPRLFAPGSRVVLLPRHLAQDIDTPEDWAQAEALYRALTASPKSD